jgi:His-Xaa-Ser system protein HxsD
VTLDLQVYRLTAVKKTAYKLADRCTAVLGSIEGERMPLTIFFPPRTQESAAIEVTRLFFQELLDQELREQISDETRAIRSLILAHAFSKTDLIRRNET